MLPRLSLTSPGDDDSHPVELDGPKSPAVFHNK